MDGWLRQSTAVTVPIGPLVDDADGNTEETGLTVAQADVRLSKNGAASAQKNNASSATHDADGVYLCPFSTTDTNTLGQLVAWIHVAGALFAKHVFMVVPANVWDSMFGTDLLQVDAREYVGVAGVAGAIPAVAAGANGGLPLGDASGRVLLQPTQAGVTIPTVTTLTNAPSDSAGVGTLLTRMGTPSNLGGGATLAGNLADIEAQTDDIGAAGAGLTALATAAALAAAQTVLDDIPTNAELAARTLAAADYATAAGVADVPTVAEFNARTMPTADYATAAGVADVPTVAEFNARTLAAADYATAAALATAQTSLNTIDARLDTEIPAIITSLGTIAGYLDTEIAAILADTNELQTDWANGGRLDLLIDGLATSIAGLNNIAAGDVLTQVNAAINAAIPELTEVPSATPTLRTALMLLFMNLRNRTTTTATEETIQNDAGATIAAAALSDDSTTFTKGEFS